MPGHLSNDDFFLRLSELFDERRKKDHGSIYLTQKRMTYSDSASADSDTELPDAAPEITTDLSSPTLLFSDFSPTKPLPLIIRASNGKSKENRDKKIKLSTIVEVEALEGFFARYAEVCKGGMSGLKKRDRSKAKEKLKAKKKKLGGAAGGVEVKK